MQQGVKTIYLLVEYTEPEFRPAQFGIKGFVPAGWSDLQGVTKCSPLGTRGNTHLPLRPRTAIVRFYRRAFVR